MSIVMMMSSSGLAQAAGESFLQNGLVEAGGALEVGGHHRFQLLPYAQPPRDFPHASTPQDVAIVPDFLDELGWVV